jgi:hypothetical protein
VETNNGPAVPSLNRNRRLLVREFTPQDVVRCLDSLSAKRNRRSFHIAFIGDSTIRQHYVMFLRVNSIFKIAFLFKKKMSIICFGY